MAEHQALVADMEQRLQAVQERLAGAPRPGVLYYFPGGFTVGSGTTMDEMMTQAGGRNVAAAAGVQGVKQLSQEILVTLNPAVILVGGSPQEQDQGGMRAFLLADPTLTDIEAIQTGRVYVVPRPYVGSLSQYVVNGVETIARMLHPDAFGGEDAAHAHLN